MFDVHISLSYNQINVTGAHGYDLTVLIKKCWQEILRMWPEYRDEVVNDVLKLSDEDLVDMLRKRGYFVKRSNVDW